MKDMWTRRQLLRVSAGGVGVGALVSQATMPAAGATNGWPQLGHDAANTGYNPDTLGPEGDGEIVWSTEVSSDFRIWHPLVAEDTVYAWAGTELSAVDTTDGTERWRYERNGPITAPAIRDNVVYFGTDDGLVELAADTGEVSRELTLENGLLSAPKIADDTLYAADDTESLYSINAATGQETWRSSPGSGLALAVGTDSIWFIDQARIVALFLDRTRESIEDSEWATNGNLLSSDGGRHVVEYENAYWWDHGPPVVSDGTAYIPGRGVQAVDIESGQELWHFDGIAVSSSPAIDDDRIYVGAGDELADAGLIEGATENSGTFYALDREDGSVEWTYEGDVPIHTSPVATSRAVFLTSEDGYVHALSAFTGEEVWSLEVGAGIGDPVIADGSLFVGSEENGLVRIDNAESTPTPTPTPTDNNDGNGDNGDNDGADSESTETPAGSGNDGGTPDEEASSDGSGPGFGVLGTLAGLGGASYLLGKRSSTDSE